MNIRTIQPEDIFKFEQIGNTEDTKATLNLSTWIEQGRTKLAWCFVAEESNEFLARIIYGVFEEQPEELKVWQLKINPSILNPLETGVTLIRESLESLKAHGFTSVEYHLYSHVVNNFDEYKRMFLQQEFALAQEKKNYEATLFQRVECNRELTFKTLHEVKDASFIEVIEQVTEDTLDREDLENISRYGSRKAASMLFELLKDIDENPTWWRLGYQEDGTLVGLVVPQRFSETRGAINYIGVVPSQRGHGYSKCFIQEATRLMFEEGIEKVVADFDVYNIPLEHAFVQQGYMLKGSLAILKKNLTRFE